MPHPCFLSAACLRAPHFHADSFAIGILVTLHTFTGRMLDKFQNAEFGFCPRYIHAELPELPAYGARALGGLGGPVLYAPPTFPRDSAS